MTLAVLCSGQGLQHAAMFDMTARDPAAQPIFAAAARHLDGRDPRTLAAEAPEQALHGNAVAQILCCTQALAAFAALASAWPHAMVLAGYSVGEWAAWSCAGCLTPERTLDLVSWRARLMDEAAGTEGGLAAVRGLSRPAIGTLCRDYGVAVAIVNPGELFILGGRRSSLDALCQQARVRGAARATLLNIVTPSHTPLLRGAVAPLLRRFEETGGASPPMAGTRLLSGLDGAMVRGTAEDAARLAAQVASPLQWAATCESAAEAGVDAVLELGPGHALSDMARTAIANVNARSLDDFKDLAGARSWLEKPRRR